MRFQNHSYNIKWISFFELFNETLSRKWKIDWLSRHERFSLNLIWNTYIHMNMNCENSNATLIYESRWFEIITCVRMYQHFQGFCFCVLNTHTYTWNEHQKNSNQCDQSGQCNVLIEEKIQLHSVVEIHS